jgi:predicted dehydrogenase
MTFDRIRWGILATGTIARHFAADLTLVPDADLVAVGSRSQEAADRFAAEFGAPDASGREERAGAAKRPEKAGSAIRAHGSWQALVDDPDVDVVYVATPHSAHHAATLACLRAGKPALTEKPFTLDLEEAEELVETARSAGVFLMEAMWTRCFPAVRTIAGLVADGVIGEVTAVHADFSVSVDVPPTHRMRARELGGGALLDLGVYPVTFAHLFLGTPQTVTAHARLSPEGVDENTAVILGYPGGAVATLTCGLVSDGTGTAAVLGTTGRIELPKYFLRPDRFALTRGDGEPVWHEARHEGLGYHFEAAEVHRCLREGLTESPVVPLAETLAVMATLDAIRERIGVFYD